MPDCRHVTRKFQGRGGFMGQGQALKKIGSAENILELFLLNTLETIF